MQLTRLDRWLLENFVQETQIYTMREPEQLPSGIRHEELPERPGQRFKHRYTTRSLKTADQFLTHLKQSGQMFTTRVVDRKVWYAPILGPKGRSVTWWIFWKIVLIHSLIGLAILLMRLWNNPTVRENVLDAIRVLKG